MKKTLLVFSLLLASVIGCRAQSVCTVAAPCTTVPTAPTVEVILAWGASSSHGVSYAIYRSPSTSVSYVRIDTTNVTATTYTDTTVTQGSSYNYFVEAYTSSTNFSGPSNIANVTLPSLDNPATSLTAAP